MKGQLSSIWKALPLPKFTRESKLCIRSSNKLSQKLLLDIYPEWREDGYITLYQKRQREAKGDDEDEVDMQISNHPSDSNGGHSLEPSVTNVYLDKKTKFQQQEHVKRYYQYQSEAFRGTVGLGNRKDSASRPDSYNPTSSPSSPSSIDDNGRSEKYPLHLVARIPYFINLNCNLESEGDIHIQGSKLECSDDAYLHIFCGNIHLNSKVRATNLHLHTRRGNIIGKKAMEADRVRVQIDSGGRFRTKLLHSGASTKIHVCNHEDGISSSTENSHNDDEDDTGALVDISSLYTSSKARADVLVDSSRPNRNVRIKYHHGHLSIRHQMSSSSISSLKSSLGVASPNIELNGVNGSFDITLLQNQKKLDESKLLPDHDDNDYYKNYMAARIHIDRLSSNSISSLSTMHGNVDFSFDRKMTSDIRLLSSKEIQNFMDELITTHKSDESTILQLLNQYASSSSSLDSQRIQTPQHGFTPHHTILCPDKSLHYVSGEILNTNPEEPLTRFDASRGKIDVRSASLSALDKFHHDGATSSSSDAPLLIAGTSGNIHLEKLSWVDAIAKRFGMK